MRTLYTKASLSRDRKSLVIYTDLNTFGRNCGESRAEWEVAAVVALVDLPGVLDKLVSSPDGTEVVL